MSKMIVFDVDGTILDNKSGAENCNVPDKEALDTIKNIAKKGYAVMFASGRSYYELENIFDDLSFKTCFAASDGSICCMEERELLSFTVSRNDIVCIFNMLKGFGGIGIEFCSKYLSYVYGTRKFVSSLRKERNNQVKVMAGMSDIESDIYKITVYGINSFVKIKLKSALGANLRFAYESEEICEIVSKNANKQIAVETFKNTYLAAGGTVIAVGDGDNDIPILKNANLAFAMESAGGHIKSICHETIKNISEIDEIL